MLGDGVQYLALTATAPLFVRHAICDALGIGPADMVRRPPRPLRRTRREPVLTPSATQMLGSVVRDNIAIEVYPDESDAKLVELVNSARLICVRVGRHPAGPGFGSLLRLGVTR